MMTSRRTFLKGFAAVPFIPQLATAAPNALQTRVIPGTQDALPVVGFGTWQSLDVSTPADLSDVRETMKRFVGEGGRVVDSSPMYGRSESVVGQMSRSLALESTLFLATKVWTTGKSEGIRQMEESFTRINSRRMDLMQIHNLLDVETHIPTLRDWKATGKIRYWGITHYHSGAYSEVERIMKSAHPDFLQINYSLAEPESAKRLLPMAQDLGIAVIVNRPFGQGSLFQAVKGKQVPEWAADFDARSWAQVFLKWILANPAVTCAIPATRKPAYVVDNMGGGRGRLPNTEHCRQISELFFGRV